MCRAVSDPPPEAFEFMPTASTTTNRQTVRKLSENCQAAVRKLTENFTKPDSQTDRRVDKTDRQLDI